MISIPRALEILRHAKVMAYDVETTGVDRAARICGYVFTGDGESVYIPVRHEGGGNVIDPEELEETIDQLFAERTRQGLLTVGHNIAFDLKMSRRHGVLIRGPLEDTMVNEGLINDISGAYSLDACVDRRGVTRKLGTELYNTLASIYGGVPDRKQMANFWRLPGDHPLVIEYAAGDGVSTLELWTAQQPLLDNLDLRRVHKLECDLIPHLDRINSIGLRVDEDYAEQIRVQIDHDIQDALLSFPLGFNVNSPKECQELFDGHGITNYSRTPTGKPSFREKWLETNEPGRNILRVRQLRKAKDSFIAPLVDTCNENGRVHPVLNQSKSDEYGAIGGRLSCSDPNLQAFPKRNKTVGKLVRRLIVPDDGMLLEEDDFNQQEPRLFGHYSGDEKVIGGYLADPPVNIHRNTQRLLEMESYDSAKRLAMGMLTGLGYKGLAEHLGTDVDTATNLFQKFLAAFPSIRQFQADAKETAKFRRNVRTLLGRLCNLPDPRYAYQAVSRIIQGSGADISKTALLRACQFAEAEGNIQILMSIHDSFIHQSTPDANVGELRRILNDVATSLGVILPIPIETAGRAKDWASASYGSPENLP